MFAGGERHGTCHAAIAEVGDDNFIAGRELERAQDGVGAGRRVVDEGEVVARHAKELTHRIGSRTQPRLTAGRGANDDLGQFAEQIAARVLFDLVTDLTLGLEHAARRHAHGSVIEVGQAGFERP